MNEITSALISITLVMMLVFIPVSFMSGTSGVFYRQFGLTMAMSIALSALNALTLTPALCALFLKPHMEKTETGEMKEKQTFLKRFFYWFNVMFDALLKKYKKATEFFIKRKWLSMGVVVASISLMVWLMAITPTALVPEEDTGTIMGVIDMPPATAQERTQEVVSIVDSIASTYPAIETRTAITGYSFIAGQGNSYGSLILKLKHWDNRDYKTENADAILNSLSQQVNSTIKNGRVMFFKPPMISGYSATNGFDIKLQDKTGGDLNNFFKVAQNFLAQLNQRPEIQMAYTTFNPSYPQYLVEIDVAKVKQAGLRQNDILSALQGYYAGMYISNFNRF